MLLDPPSLAAASDEILRELVENLAGQALHGQLQLATAESCTGGWIAKLITDLAGSSAWFQGALVTYSNRVKETQLGVPAHLLEQFGAVSQPVAEAMVAGALARLEADLAVAVTGIAGPGGGSEAKPVGTVWFAWQRQGAAAQTQRRVFPGDREAVRRQTAAVALAGLSRMLAPGLLA